MGSRHVAPRLEVVELEPVEARTESTRASTQALAEGSQRRPMHRDGAPLATSAVVLVAAVFIALELCSSFLFDAETVMAREREHAAAERRASIDG